MAACQLNTMDIKAVFLHSKDLMPKCLDSNSTLCKQTNQKTGIRRGDLELVLDSQEFHQTSGV